MREFIEFVVSRLVDKPESLSITEVQQNDGTLYELRMDPSDVGKIIGRQGTTIQTIRSLMQTGAAKKGLHCSLEIVEDAPAR